MTAGRGHGPAHSAAEFAVLAPAARYARAFNALGWENFAEPVSNGVWFTLANGQGRGRHLAFKVL